MLVDCATCATGLRGHAGAALVAGAALLLSGCAGPLSLFGLGNEAALFRDPALSAQAAGAQVAPGTPRARVRELLGPTRSVRFESGYEIWAYRGSDPGSTARGRAEFIVLFGPDGTVRKTRLRPPGGAAGDNGTHE